MALVGDLRDLTLVDIIQINCIGRNTARLTVHYPIGDGIFYFEAGEIVDARLGNLIGAEVIYKALYYENGAFRIDTGITAPTRTIFEPWTNLVMEGVRLLDEARAGMNSSSNFQNYNEIAQSPSTKFETGKNQNIYQLLISDLIKIKGIDGAIIVNYNGKILACTKIESREKVGLMCAFLMQIGKQFQLKAAKENPNRITISYGQQKVTIFNQDHYIALVGFATITRFETINSHIERAFRKSQTRTNMNTSNVVGTIQ